MEKRTLGGGLRVSPLGYGAMELRVPENYGKAELLLNTALDCGMDLIDTSPDYGPSEELVGKYISHRRSEFTLATKCACNLSGVGPGHIFTAAQIGENLNQSLRRLRTDTIDLWQLHCATPPDLPGGTAHEVVEAMLRAKREGKVRAIGLSFKNGSAGDPAYPTEHQRLYAQEMASWGVFDCIQMVFGLLTPVSAGDIAGISARGMGVIARGALKQYFPWYADMARECALGELCAPGEGLHGLLVRFAVSTPGVSAVIAGSASAEHLRANAEAARRPLEPEVYARAAARVQAWLAGR